MPPPGKASPEDIKDLGLEEIADSEKRQQVVDFFTSRPDLLADIMHEKKKTREVLASKIQEFNRTQLQTQQIIDGIIRELQKDSLERDLNEGYIDSEGQSHESYIEQYQKEVDRVEVDFVGVDKDRENVIRKACLGEVVKAVRAVPLNVKREYRHQYVRDMIAEYVKAMGENQDLWWGIGTLGQEEIRKFHPASFEGWAHEPGRPQESELTQKYEPAQAREFIQSAAKTKESLAKVQESASTLSPELQEYFKKNVKEIEGFMSDNAAGASDASQKLLAEVTAATGMLALKTEIQAKSGETTNEAIKKKYTDLFAKIDANLKAAPNEKDPAKRKALFDSASLQAEKSRIDAEAAAAPPAPAAPEGAKAEEEEPDFTKSPQAWLQYQINGLKKWWGEIVGFLGAILGFFGIKSALIPAGAETAAETPKQQEARKFLIEKIKLTDDESRKLTPFKLGEFLKLSSPPEGFDKTRFETLKKAVNFNKKPEDKDDTPLLDFVADKKADWKEAPAKGTA